MSGGRRDKEAEVKADLIQHAIEGRLIGDIDRFYPENDLQMLRMTTLSLNDEYEWFHYRNDWIGVSDLDAAREEQKELRGIVFD